MTVQSVNFADLAEGPLRSIMLRLDNVALRYDDGPEVLRDLNLALERGDFMFLMGPTGAGKTSLLRLLGLLHMPCRGEFTLFGRKVAGLQRDELAALRRRVGIVFQDVRLLDHCRRSTTSPCRSGSMAARMIRSAASCPRCSPGSGLRPSWKPNRQTCRWASVS